MRLEENINQDIERCQAQIAAIYSLPLSEQCPITLEGFQRKLKFLFNEKSTFNIKVYQARVVLPNGSQCSPAEYGSSIKQRALQTHHKTIQQLKRA